MIFSNQTIKWVCFLHLPFDRMVQVLFNHIRNSEEIVTTSPRSHGFNCIKTARDEIILIESECRKGE